MLTTDGAYICNLYEPVYWFRVQHGTIRNKIIVGHSRIRIYLANLIVCAIASVLISLSYTVGVFVIGNMNGGELITETATIFLCMISSLMISITFASIMTLLAILNTIRQAM